MMAPRWRWLVAGVALVGIVVPTGCVTDRSGAAEPRTWCGAAAELTEALVASGGKPAATLASPLDTLESATDSDAVTPTVQELRSLADADADADSDAEAEGGSDPGGEPDRAQRAAWDTALADLDAEVEDRCEFSMQVIVAGAAAEQAPEVDKTQVPDESGSGKAAFGWNGVLDRLDGKDWVDNGYDGIVGEEPGMFITVFGVESTEMAATVCRDVIEAMTTGPDAVDDLTVEVHGLGRHLLARSTGGTCTT